jgi:hypothetical protein
MNDIRVKKWRISLKKWRFMKLFDCFFVCIMALYIFHNAIMIEV